MLKLTPASVPKIIPGRLQGTVWVPGPEPSSASWRQIPCLCYYCSSPSLLVFLDIHNPCKLLWCSCWLSISLLLSPLYLNPLDNHLPLFNIPWDLAQISVLVLREGQDALFPFLNCEEIESHRGGIRENQPRHLVLCLPHFCCIVVTRPKGYRYLG